MKIRKIQPSFSLQRVVRHYWIYEVDATDVPFAQLLLPYNSFELIFNLTGIPQIANDSNACNMESLYVGQFTKPMLLKYADKHKSVGISFYPWSGDLLFRTPASIFTDCCTPFQDIDKCSDLQNRLLDAQDDDELVLLCESYLLKKLSASNVDLVSLTVVNALLHDPSAQALNHVVDGIGGSRRRIEQRFLRSTGLTLGLFQRKIRFQKAMEILLASENESLTSVGLRAGYYDQSHFIREFKAFSGLRPKDFLTYRSMDNLKSEMKDLLMFNVADRT